MILLFHTHTFVNGISKLYLFFFPFLAIKKRMIVLLYTISDDHTNKLLESLAVVVLLIYFLGRRGTADDKILQFHQAK